MHSHKNMCIYYKHHFSVNIHSLFFLFLECIGVYIIYNFLIYINIILKKYLYVLLYTPGVNVFLFLYLFLYIDTYTLLDTPTVHGTYTSTFIT